MHIELSAGQQTSRTDLWAWYGGERGTNWKSNTERTSPRETDSQWDFGRQQRELKPGHADNWGVGWGGKGRECSGGRGHVCIPMAGFMLMHGRKPKAYPPIKKTKTMSWPNISEVISRCILMTLQLLPLLSVFTHSFIQVIPAISAVP